MTGANGADDEDDEGPPTKRDSAGLGYVAFCDESIAAAERLEAYAQIVSKRHDLRDPALLAEASDLARRLRVFARRFDLWPELGVETVAFMRATMLPELVTMMRRAVEIVSSLPTHGALGVVPPVRKK